MSSQTPRLSVEQILQRQVSPDQVLYLQRTVGNRAVSQFIHSQSPSTQGQPQVQPKLSVGPAGDRYEREADRIATQVVNGPARMSHPRKQEADEQVQRSPLANTITPLRQPVEPLQGRTLTASTQDKNTTLRCKPDLDRGGDPGSSFRQQLRGTQGRGQPLGDDVRQAMESSFGASFDQVRVHTGPDAIQMTRDIQAEAFTHGTDVYFNQDKFNPGAKQGRHLLAHELTHVVQQTGATVQRKATPPPQITEGTSVPSIQPSRLGKAWGKFKSLFSKGRGKKGGDSSSSEPKEIGESESIEQEEIAPTKPVEKKATTEKLDQIATPDWINPLLKDEKPTRYAFTVAVARQNPEYLTFAKERAKITLRNKMRAKFINKIKGIRDPKNSNQIRDKAARKTVEKRAVQPEGSTIEEEVAAMVKRTRQVGHTWVKFTAYVGDDLHSLFSYGFYPEGGFAHPQKAVPGIVDHPDKNHEGGKEGEERIDATTTVGGKNFVKGLRRAEDVRKAKPQYMLAGFNCTTFAKQIASATSVSFPSSGSLFPAEPAKAFFQILHNPNKLYESLEKKVGTEKKGYRVSNQSEGYGELFYEKMKVEGVRQRQEQTEMQERTTSSTPYEVTNPKAIFFEGSQPGDKDYIHNLGEQYDIKLFVTDTTPRTFVDPEDPRQRQFEFLACLYSHEGRPLKEGWVRADAVSPLGSSSGEYD